jgi:hypothetical protein
MEVAGHSLNPRVRDRDQRFPEVFVCEADGFVHGASRSLVAPVSDIATAMFEVHEAVLGSQFPVLSKT